MNKREIKIEEKRLRVTTIAIVKLEEREKSNIAIATLKNVE